MIPGGGGGGGTRKIFWWGCARSGTPKKGGGVLGAGTAENGGLRCGYNPKRVNLELVL